MFLRDFTILDIQFHKVMSLFSVGTKNSICSSYAVSFPCKDESVKYPELKNMFRFIS